MATYISLLRFTDQSAEKLKGAPAQLDAAKQAFQAMGAQLKDFYVMMGEYDALIIFEAPDDEAALKLAFATGAGGGVTTDTVRAFTEDEFRKIIVSICFTPYFISPGICFNHINIRCAYTTLLGIPYDDIPLIIGLLNTKCLIHIFPTKSPAPQGFAKRIRFKKIHIGFSCAETIGYACNDISPIIGLLNILSVVEAFTTKKFFKSYPKFILQSVIFFSAFIVPILIIYISDAGSFEYLWKGRAPYLLFFWLLFLEFFLSFP